MLLRSIDLEWGCDLFISLDLLFPRNFPVCLPRLLLGCVQFPPVANSALLRTFLYIFLVIHMLGVLRNTGKMEIIGHVASGSLAQLEKANTFTWKFQVIDNPTTTPTCPSDGFIDVANYESLCLSFCCWFFGWVCFVLSVCLFVWENLNQLLLNQVSIFFVFQHGFWFVECNHWISLVNSYGWSRNIYSFQECYCYLGFLSLIQYCLNYTVYHIL